MWKKIALIGIALTAILCVGCFDYAEEMVINDNGSGTIQMHFAMDKTYLKAIEKMTREMAEAMGGEAGDMDTPTPGFSRDEIEKALATGNSGVKLISFDTSETEDASIWDMKFSFDNVNNVYAAIEAIQSNEEDAADDTSEPGDDEDMPQVVFTKQADGTWLFERPLNDGDEMSGMAGDMDMADSEADHLDEDDMYGDSDVDDEMGDSDVETGDAADDGDEADTEGIDEFAEGMQAMFGNIGNHTIKMTVTFPGEVIESNATSVDGSTATWEYKLADWATAVKNMRAVIKK